MTTGERQTPPEARERAEQDSVVERVSAPLEPAVRALGMLSPQSQEMAASLIRQLAEREGVHVALTSAPGIQTPAEGIPLRVASLKAGRYAERAVHMYEYLATRYLRSDPAPTKLGVQSYLAQRLEEASTAAVSNERKALASLFGLLHGEGLWPSNPLNGVRHVKAHYRERLCPDAGDIAKVLEGRCLRRRDTAAVRHRIWAREEPDCCCSA